MSGRSFHDSFLKIRPLQESSVVLVYTSCDGLIQVSAIDMLCLLALSLICLQVLPNSGQGMFHLQMGGISEWMTTISSMLYNLQAYRYNLRNASAEFNREVFQARFEFFGSFFAREDALLPTLMNMSTLGNLEISDWTTVMNLSQAFNYSQLEFPSTCNFLTYSRNGTCRYTLCTYLQGAYLLGCSFTFDFSELFQSNVKVNFAMETCPGSTLPTFYVECEGAGCSVLRDTLTPCNTLGDPCAHNLVCTNLTTLFPGETPGELLNLCVLDLKSSLPRITTVLGQIVLVL